MIQLQIKTGKHLISAYNQMMQEMRDAFKHSEASDMCLQKALELATHQVVHVGDVTAAEADEIGKYIKQDINDAAEYMMDSSAQFYDWLMLDIEVIEGKVMQLFLLVAEQTRVELEQLVLEQPTIHGQPAKTQTAIVNSDEISSSEFLICKSCGKTSAFLYNSTIDSCEHCNHRYLILQQANKN